MFEKNDGREHELLSRQSGQKVAEEFRELDQMDPFPNIRPALLSADDIIKYVEKTGAISPFSDGNRLKIASYEGRLGENAYEYDEQGKLKHKLIKDNLIIGANSIVFVECDLDFRLPEFIALRFNLQIRHVHRGLLLGTGPLIDPGYWGKLCIPLHNLTNENYPISKSDGLIWIEFTKISGLTTRGRAPLGREFWNIRDFLIKASDQLDGPTPIRSSIPLMAIRAEKAAETSKEKLKKFTQVFFTFGTAGILAFVVSLYLLISAFYSNIGDNNKFLSSRIEKIGSFSDQKIDSNRKDVDQLKFDLNFLSEKFESLMYENRKQDEKIRDLENKLSNYE